MTEKTNPSGVPVQAWVTPKVAEQLRATAAAEERSVSAVVRRAVVAHLREERTSNA